MKGAWLVRQRLSDLGRSDKRKTAHDWVKGRVVPSADDQFLLANLAKSWVRIRPGSSPPLMRICAEGRKKCLVYCIGKLSWERCSEKTVNRVEFINL
jgi:hypothetical protein